MSSKADVRNAWNKKNLFMKQVCLHRGKDEELIEFVQKKLENGQNISSIFKEALVALMEKES